MERQLNGSTFCEETRRTGLGKGCEKGGDKYGLLWIHGSKGWWDENYALFILEQNSFVDRQCYKSFRSPSLYQRKRNWYCNLIVSEMEEWKCFEWNITDCRGEIRREKRPRGKELSKRRGSFKNLRPSGWCHLTLIVHRMKLFHWRYNL